MRLSAKYLCPLEKDKPFRARVLCVNEVLKFSDALALRFQNHNIEILRAYDGQHGIWMAHTEKPDVIVTGLRIRNFSGEELIDCLRRNKLTTNTPIIVVAEIQQSRDSRRLQRIGADRVFSTPVDADALLDALMSELNELL